MWHALIIHDNMTICHAIRDYLGDFGFTSFDEVWTEAQATEAARKHLPDLVVVGDSLEGSSPISVAKRIFEHQRVPILMVSGDPLSAEKNIKEASSFSGPFLLNQLEEAIGIAMGGMFDDCAEDGSAKPQILS
ncbi:MAG: hypothetical protein ACKOXK_07625 [Chakrabartia sp.]